jgi:hypothetical protein
VTDDLVPLIDFVLRPALTPADYADDLESFLKSYPHTRPFSARQMQESDLLYALDVATRRAAVYRFLYLKTLGMIAQLERTAAA